MLGTIYRYIILLLLILGSLVGTVLLPRAIDR